jgi:predicted HicB family RNase H-like nuclease
MKLSENNKMSPRKKKPEVRVYLEEDVDRLIKTLAAMRDSSINALINEAIELWLNQPEQQETIDRHRLDEIDEK